MKWLQSFRSRIVLGTFLWTLGLIPLLHLLFLALHRQMRLISAAGIKIFLIFSSLFILAGIWQFRAAILPFGRLRRQLSGLRDGSSTRIEGTYPTEVQPLVDDLNSLLEHRERIVRRALAKAGDLAHGLKTPLAVLSQEADRADAAGQQEMASTLSSQVERMRRQIEYHLAQARAATPGNVPSSRCSVLLSVEGLTRTLGRIYAGRGLAIVADIPSEHFVRGQREDLEEMLGNLLDNACKWATSKVRIQSVQEDRAIVITVDDDGPGIPSSIRDQVLRRGVRYDETAPGSGLGLAIVRDLAELYEGSIALENSPMGGLRASLRLPS
ncbi:MAG: ATP-binding protein [Candidatus Acidiferrum sp.]|jgi:signal transduction histidine kinase